MLDKRTPFGRQTFTSFNKYKQENRDKQEKFENELEINNIPNESAIKKIQLKINKDKEKEKRLLIQRKQSGQI